MKKIMLAIAKIFNKPFKKQDLYFIRTTRFVGNSLLWWGPNSCGYTTDLNKAGKYTLDKAIARDSHWTEKVYRVNDILESEGVFATFYADYIYEIAPMEEES